MLFFFKKKPVEITAFLPAEFAVVNEFYPIKPAKEHFPKWWKDVESSKFDWDLFNKKNTIKSCPGVISTLRTGFIMPLWSDLAIEYDNEDWRYLFSDGMSQLIHHNNKQMPGFYEDHLVFKLESPWVIESAVDLVYAQPFYSQYPAIPFIQPYGISVPTANLHATNVFLFAKRDVSNKVLLKVGTPLYHIIPLTDRPVKFKTEVIDQHEYNKKRSLQSGSTSFASKALKLNFISKNNQ